MATTDKYTQIELENLSVKEFVQKLTQIQLDAIRWLSAGGGIPPDPEPSKKIAIATRGSHLQQGLTDGTITVQTAITAHDITSDCLDLRLVYGNYFGNSSDGEQLTPNDIKVKAIVAHDGKTYVVNFPDSSTQITLKPGEIVETATSNISVKKGDIIKVRTLVTVNAGEKFPRGQVVQTSRGEGFENSDVLESGTVTQQGSFVYHPIAIVGSPIVPTSAVLLLGDSIMAGADDSPQDEGFAVKAIGNKMAWIRIAQGNESSYSFKGENAKLRLALAKYCTDAICNYGTNDLMSSDLATYKTDIQAVWKLLTDQGLKVFQTTMTPRTTSTDSFQTPGNQTPVKPSFGPTGVRSQANDWIRTVPTPLSGIFDITKGIESGLNSGAWATSLNGVDSTRTTREGIHPWMRGSQLMSKEVDITKIDPNVQKDVKLTSVGSRGKWYDKTSNGTDINTTYRTIHEAMCDMSDLTLMYGAFYQDGRTTNIHPYTINISVDIKGVNYPITFDKGKPSKNVALGDRILTDTIKASLIKGERFFVRTHVVQNAGEKHPVGITTFSAGEGVADGDATTGTFTTRNPAPAYVLGPLALYGTPASTVLNFKTVGLCGDSISVGAGRENSPIDGHPVGDIGFLQLGAMKAGWGYVTIGMNGQKASDFAAPGKRVNQLHMVKDCDLVIVEYGTNDYLSGTQTFDQVKTSILAIHKAYWDMGIPTIQTTISPSTNSTDVWTTVANQTPTNTLTAGGEDSVRSKINNWIRSNTDGIRHIEAADVWESGRNTGLWKDTGKYTTDGIHPHTLGHDNASLLVRDFLLTQ